MYFFRSKDTIAGVINPINQPGDWGKWENTFHGETYFHEKMRFTVIFSLFF